MAKVLHSLGLKYKVGKANPGKTFFGMNYFDIYELYFEQFRQRPINLLELGVLGGKSLKVWKAYFPKAQIFGLDIDPACSRYADERTHITIGSQADPKVLQAITDHPKIRGVGLHIVIDDGSHLVDHMISSFERLWPFIVSKGVYAIEDLRCTYLDLRKHDVLKTWPGMKYNPPDINLVNDRHKFEIWMLNKITNLDQRRGTVAAVNFWHELAVFLKVPSSTCV